MAGLLDLINSPAGMGLLSAVASGAAGARQNTPWNNFGRGALGGLAGYSQANDQIKQDEENAFQKQFRQTQMEQMQRQLETQQKQEQWRAGLPGIMAPKVSDQGAMLNEQNAAFGNDATQATIDAGQYAPNAPIRMTPQVDQQAVQDYMLRPESPYSDKLMEKQLFPSAADYKTVGKTLLQVGPNGVNPVYTDQTPEKSGLPNKAQEYEYAVANGYKGTFTDYIKIVPEAQAAFLSPFRMAEKDSKESRDAYDLPPSVKPPVRPSPAPQSFSVTAPDGNVFTFPNKKAADAFKRQIGVM